MAVRSTQDNVSDAKVRQATGRGHDEWHAMLDAAGASDWSHKKIAAWLHKEQGVDGWWAQSITVGYEQARGKRVPGQKTDGSFETSASKTVVGGVGEVLERAVAVVADHVASEPANVSPAAKYPTARWALDDGTSLLITLTDVSKPDEPKVRVALTRGKLAGPEELGAAKAELSGILSALSTA